MDKIIHRTALALLLCACNAEQEHQLPERRLPAGLTLALGGDVMFGRMTPDGWRAHSAVELDSWAPALRDADFGFVNLETGICDEGRTRSEFPLLWAPPDRLDRLVDAGVDVVSIANNHALDCGPDGISQTTAALTQRGISVAGVDPAVVGEIVVVAATMHRPPYASSGPRLLNADDDLPDHVRATRQRHPRKLLLVSIHWGRERSTQVGPFQRKLAHALVDAGADVIAGHGPHTQQLREDYRGAPIYYSLGNLVFDDRTAVGQTVAPQRVAFRRDSSTWRALPVASDR